MIRTPKQTSSSDGLNLHAGAVRLKVTLQLGLAALALAGAWWSLTAWLLLIVVLASAWAWLARARWGRDLTWSDGAWVDTGMTAWRAGIGASSGAVLREPASARKAVLFWCVVLAALLLSSLPWWLDPEEELALGPVLMMLVLAAVLLLALYTAVRTRTLNIQWDDAGLSETHFFGTRRVPWSAIGTLAPQVKPGPGARGDYPEKGVAWMLCDTLGRRIMRLDAGLTPEAAFEDLRQRIRRAIDPQLAQGDDWTPREPPDDEEVEPDEGGAVASADASQAAWLATRERMARQRSLRDPQNIMMLLTMVLVLAPFLLGTLYMCWTAAWFSLAASRVAGEVVEVDRSGVTSLLVEYRVSDGRLLRVQTDGSDLYAHYKLGDAVQVLYDPRDPADARADLFLELWLLPMLLGGLTLVLALAMGLIAWGMTRPFMPP